MRIPGWAKGKPVPSDLYSYLNSNDNYINLFVNGKVVEYKTINGYMACTRSWKQGDVITFELPMDIHHTTANELVKDDEGLVAVERGPVVYCLEWADNTDLQSCVINDDASSFVEWTNDMNGFDKLIFNGQKATLNSNGKAIAEEATITAIPYYAWANRGKGYMAVWIPRTIDKATTKLGDVIDTDTLTYELKQIPFTNTSAKIYDSTPVEIDEDAIASSLGLSTEELTSLFGSMIIYSALNPDGTHNVTSTANAPGHWFRYDGYATSYNSDSYVFSEMNISNHTFNIGQYPKLCKPGEEYTIKQALTYLPEEDGEEMKRVVFVFKLKIVAELIDVVSDTLTYIVEEVPFTNTSATIYDSTPVRFNNKQAAEILEVEDFAEAYSAGNLTYSVIEPDGTVNTVSTANAPGHWFDAYGNVTTYSSGNSVVFSEFDKSNVAFNIGQYPNRCSIGNQYEIMQAFTNNNADGNGTYHRVILKFIVKIVENIGNDETFERVVIPEAGWASFSSVNNLDFNKVEEISAYYVDAANEGMANIVKIDNPSGNTGLILSGDPGIYDIPVVAFGEKPEVNLLVPTCNGEVTLSPTGEGNWVYAFGYKPNDYTNVGFYTIYENRTIAIKHSYLKTNNDALVNAGVNFIRIILENPTGIKSAEFNRQMNENIYDLQGRKVAIPSKGIYIVNGKKVLLK